MTLTRMRCLAVASTLVYASGLYALDVAGVRVHPTQRVEATELLLNGAGVRSKLFLKVYVGALYVSQKTPSATAILDDGGPRRIVLRMLRDLEADSLVSAMEDGLRNNHAPTELAGIKAQSEQLAGIIKGVGTAREGDELTLDFMSDGVRVSCNGQLRGKVAGGGFAKALLKVWLGESPADASLKKALLGG